MITRYFLVSIWVFFQVILNSQIIFAFSNLKLPFTGGQTWKLTCGYGNGYHTAQYGADYGMDFDNSAVEDGEPGEPVISPMDGTVEVAGLYGGFGNAVKINDGTGYTVILAHLRRLPMVNIGEVVVQGQQVGIMGGTSTNGEKKFRDHIHFQLSYNGKSVKPEPMSGYSNFNEDNTYLLTCPF